MMAVLILPLALILTLFSSEVLRLWTGNPVLATYGAPIVMFLVAGTAINGIMFLPYALQLANGWTSLGLTVSVCMCLVMVPAVYFMAAHFGGVGAAAVWLAVNALNLAITFPLTHRRLLRREALKWLGEDLCMPLLGAAAVVFLARGFAPVPSSRLMAGAELLLVLALASLAAAVSAPMVRAWSGDQLRLILSWSR